MTEEEVLAFLAQLGIEPVSDEELTSKTEPLVLMCGSPPSLVPGSIVTDCDSCGTDVVVSPASVETLGKAESAGRKTKKLCIDCVSNRLSN